MFFLKFKKRFHKKYVQKVNPDEIFMDSVNLPGFDTYQFEGRIEKPISDKTFWLLGSFFFLILLIFSSKTWFVQVIRGQEYAEHSANNKLDYTIVFSDRGTIYDRNNVPLAWNEKGENEFSTRKYIEKPGFSNLLGYVSYPKKDSAGNYYDQLISGIGGIEESFNDILQKENGLRIIEVNAVNEIVSENIMRKPQAGDDLHLTIDSEVQAQLFSSVQKVVDDVGFGGGAAALMDVYSGDLLAIVTYPEYDSNILANSNDKQLINSFIQDERNPFLNRVTQGLFTPGSIVKPFIAVAALQERVIGPKDKIISSGSISIPNPYNPENPSVFNDWKAHGPVDVREALAYSSNVYFYEVGGGYKEQEGLGIERVERYIRKFGFGSGLQGNFFSNISGTIPNPEWKRKTFDDDWRVGDTYFTSIGQYGFQATPLQVVRAISAVATGGMLVEPQIIADSFRTPQVTLLKGIDSWVWKTVQEGMRDSVLFGTAKGLNYSDIELAGKTGTAELGVSKNKVNSWLVSYFPYQSPKYVLMVLLESGRRENLIGGVAVGRNFFDWLKVNRPGYFE